MKKTIKYTDSKIGDFKIVEDFLPTPEKLAFRDENTKITISLTKGTVKLFNILSPFVCLISKIIHSLNHPLK